MTLREWLQKEPFALAMPSGLFGFLLIVVFFQS